MELETALSMDLTSKFFKITNIKKPKSVYVAYLSARVGDVLQIKYNPFLSTTFLVENVTNNRVWSSFKMKDLRNMFDENGCFDFIKIKLSDLDKTKQSAISL